MKYAVVTFGCRVNQADSLAIEGALRRAGGRSVPTEEADLVVVNTCAVTASAEQGARQTLRRVQRHNPDARLIVTGCYASRATAELEAFPNVVRVVPNAGKDGLFGDAVDLDAGGTRFRSGDGPCGGLEPGVGGRTALTIRVQTGCNETCSYCVIPQTRGASRSRPMAWLGAAIAQAVDAGYREIWISGVHLGSYGRDLGDGSNLLRLVGMLANWPGDVLFRLGSLEPMDCPDELVDLVAESPRLAPHWHLPLQHADDRVLRDMRRPYTADRYRRVVDRIRRLMPHAAIGSDLIVGFPGETDREFETTLRFLEQSPLTQLHVFPYSDRPGTAASRLEPKVHGAQIRERGARARAVGAALAVRFRDAQAGTTRRALTVDDGWSAVTDNHIKVRLSRQCPRNEWVKVRLAAADQAEVTA